MTTPNTVRQPAFLARLLMLMLLLLPALGARAAAFTAGNLVVLRVGDGSAALTSAATALFLDEYTPAGVFVQTIALPTAVSGSNRILTTAGTSTSEGLMTRTVDGAYLLIPGYDAAPGSTGPVAASNINTSTSATYNRIVGRVAPDGTFDTSTRLTAFSAGSPRGVAALDGSAFYVSGSNSGVNYVTFGSTGASTNISSAPANTRALSIFGGQLYLTAGSGAFQGVSTVGTGTPTTTGQTTTQLAGFPTATGPSPYGFYFADLSTSVAGLDVVYVADDRNTAAGGIQKWSLVGSTWTLNGTIASTTALLRGLTGSVSGTTVSLFGSGGGGLFAVTDNAGYNAAPSTATLPAAIATAGTNQLFRGVAFSPVSANPVNTALTITNGTFSNTAANSNSNSTNFTLTNSSASPQTVTITTSGAPFSYAGSTLVVPANGTKTFVVNFAPTAAGTFNGTVTAAVTGFQNVTSASFSAVGTAPANTALTIANGTFSSTAANSTSTSTNFTLSNSSGTAQSVTLNTSGAPFTGTTPTTVSVPATGSTTFTVTFAPTAAGTFNGTVTAVVSGFQNVTSGSFSATATAASVVPTLTAASTSTLLVGIPSIVLISGTNFSTSAGATTINYSGGTATALNVTNSTALRVTLTPTSAGAGTVTVTTTAGGTSTTSLPMTASTPPAGFFEPFESFFQTSYLTSPTVLPLSSGNVTANGVLLNGTALPNTDKRNNAQAARLRPSGYVQFARTNGVGSVTLQAAVFGTQSPTSPSFTVSYSLDGGTTFTTVAGTPADGALTATLASYSYPVNAAGSVLLRITNTAVYVASNSPQVNVDDVQLTDFNATTGNLTIVSGTQNVSGAYNNVTIVGGTANLTGALVVNGTLTVQNGGVLNTACQSVTGPGSFALQAGGTLGICSATGITASGASGAVQLSPRSYSADANYTYNGTVAQVTGAGLPARVRSLTVNNSTGVTLSAATNVAQLLALTSGNLATGGNTFTLLSIDGQGSAVVDNTGGVVTGTATVQRAVDQTPVGTSGNTGYHHYSSPVAATTLPDLDVPGAFANTYNTAYNSAVTPGTTRPFPTVFAYDETRLATSPAVGLDAFSKGWLSPVGTEAMPVGKGYSANIPNALVVDFVGTLNNGNIDITGLTRGADAGAGYHLVGNPYPAPLNWDNVVAGRRVGLDGAAYVFNSTGPYSGSYRSRTNGVGGIYGDVRDALIPSAAGFFVRTNAGQTGAINLINTDRVTTFGPQPAFGRSATAARPMLRLALTNAANTVADDAFVYCEAGASLNVDANFDAAKLANPSGLNVATTAGNQQLAINGLPVLANATVLVPLTVAVPAAGAYTFTAAGLSNFGATTVVLRDALTGTRTVLTAGTAYRFTTATTSANGRFVLELNPAAAPLASASQALAALVQVYPNPARGAFHLSVPASAKAATVRLTNVLGQTVLTRSLTSAEADFSTSGLAVGVYTLRLAVDGATITRKVVVE